MLLPLLLGGAALAYYAMTRKPTAGFGATQGPGNLETIQGRSGTVYGVGLSQVPAPVAGDVKVFDVYLFPSGTKVMTYAQKGSDKSARSFIASPLADNDPILNTAKTDFL